MVEERWRGDGGAALNEPEVQESPGPAGEYEVAEGGPCDAAGNQAFNTRQWRIRVHSGGDSGVVRRPFTTTPTEYSGGGEGEDGEGTPVLKLKVLKDFSPSHYTPRPCLVGLEERGAPGNETE
ncbi:hypothetical protein E2C01_053793 [Portunus trituberculatus]|uniref:Uncharacterized protein n=1 Tax=Portunus trituberculatus TaxID=210409 RepID=A0A5B7GR07_PORTR|nr:hypothetical protein [Portunus trituberculatus]